MEKSKMIKIMYSASKTNAFNPTPWHWAKGFQGGGFRYSVSLAAGVGYEPKFVDGVVPSADGFRCPTVATDNQPTRLVETSDGKLCLVSCSQEQDEKLMLITLRGGFDGIYSVVEGHNAEILMRRADKAHGVPTGHLLVRLTDPKGFLFAETGRRSGTGIVEVFTWEGYTPMLSGDFPAWRKKRLKNR